MMKLRFHTTTALLLALLFTGCARTVAPPVKARQTSPDPDVAHVDGRPVIMRLVGRETVVTVTRGTDGPLYSAATREGRLLVSAATLDELREEHPDVYRFVHPATAADASNHLPQSSIRSFSQPAPFAGRGVQTSDIFRPD